MIGTLSYDTSVASADRMDGLSALAAATRTSCEAFTAVVFQSFRVRLLTPDTEANTFPFA